MATVTINDPRYLDGEPHDVADTAGKQTLEALDLAEEALEGFSWAARGAWLSAEEYRTGKMPNGVEFGTTRQGLIIEAIRDHLTGSIVAMRVLRTAAAFDPHCNV